jgi:hypothetical protein
VKTSVLRLSLGLLLCMACDQERKESQACLDARAAARQLATDGKADEAHTELERAKSECGEPSEYDIDRIERQVERLVRRQRQTADAELRPGPLGPFIDWVITQREEKDRNQGNTECEPRDSELFGFCTSRLAREGEPPFEVQYLKSQPDEVFRFRWSTSAPLHCRDAGPFRLVASWKESGAEYELCELTEHALRGLEVLLTRRADRSDVDIFSQKYLLERPNFAKTLRRR